MNIREEEYFMKDQEVTKNKAEFVVNTTQEDYKLEYSEYIKLLDQWQAQQVGREYEIVELDNKSFKITAKENG